MKICVLYAFILSGCLALPTLKLSNQSASIDPVPMIPGEKIPTDESSDEGDINRSKKSATTFCVEIKGNPDCVPCQSAQECSGCVPCQPVQEYSPQQLPINPPIRQESPPEKCEEVYMVISPPEVEKKVDFVTVPVVVSVPKRPNVFLVRGSKAMREMHPTIFNNSEWQLHPVKPVDEMHTFGQQYSIVPHQQDAVQTQHGFVINHPQGHGYSLHSIPGFESVPNSEANPVVDSESQRNPGFVFHNQQPVSTDQQGVVQPGNIQYSGVNPQNQGKPGVVLYNQQPIITDQQGVVQPGDVQYSGVNPQNQGKPGVVLYNKQPVITDQQGVVQPGDVQYSGVNPQNQGKPGVVLYNQQPVITDQQGTLLPGKIQYPTVNPQNQGNPEFLFHNQQPVNIDQQGAVPPEEMQYAAVNPQSQENPGFAFPNQQSFINDQQKPVLSGGVPYPAFGPSVGPENAGHPNFVFHDQHQPFINGQGQVLFGGGLHYPGFINNPGAHFYLNGAAGQFPSQEAINYQQPFNFNRMPTQNAYSPHMGFVTDDRGRSFSMAPVNINGNTQICLESEQPNNQQLDNSNQQVMQQGIQQGASFNAQWSRTNDRPIETTEESYQILEVPTATVASVKLGNLTISGNNSEPILDVKEKGRSLNHLSNHSSRSSFLKTNLKSVGKGRDRADNKFEMKRGTKRETEVNK